VQAPLELQCAGCQGQGCDECDNTGFLILTTCPQRELTTNVIELTELSELYSQGLPPVAGGALDQTKSFLDAHRQLTHDQQFLKRSLGIV